MKQYIRYIVATVIIIILTILFTGLLNRQTADIAIDSITPKDTLSVAIGFKKSMFYSKGLPTGFQYELLDQLAKGLGKEIKILSPFSCKNYWELLLNNQIDIIVLDTSDSIPKKYSEQILSNFAREDYRMVIKKENKDFLKNLNLWYASYILKPEYAYLRRKFFRSYRTDPYLDNFTQTKIISPYDDAIKAYSKAMGWDWRLLAALIYQESRFSISAHSSKGAVGLMQIKPSTAEHYGVKNIFDPKNNIKAGSLHLKSIQDAFLKKGIDSANVIKFTLASYNAGESRINDCMKFTKAQGNDSLNWEEVARTIPFMSMPEYYKEADLRHGKFKGIETIEYVDNVLSKYEEYKFVIKD